FNRIPDVGGLHYWDGVFDSGTPLSAIAPNFVGSAEFQAKYGTLTDAAYVTQLYANVLSRAPDAGGLSFWETYLTEGHTRGDVLIGFAGSAENVAKVAAAGWLFVY